MYCNSCLLTIPREDVKYCEQCMVPLHEKCVNHCLICGKILCDTCYGDNSYKCEDCYKPDETFSVIRRSHIEQYASCPYSLYLELILGIAPPMGKHAQLGIIVHELIDKDAHYPTTLAQMKLELVEKIEEWNLKTDDEYSIITVELEEAGMLCLENYFLIRNEFGKDFETEKQIKFSIDDNLPKISCTLDRIEKVDGDIHIHDWKTGKPMSGQKLVTDLQPPLYIYAVFTEYGIMPKTFSLHYLQPNKHITYKYMGDNKYSVTTTRNTYELDILDAVERTKSILHDIKCNKFAMPEEAKIRWKCDSMCWYGLTEKCAGNNDEEWKQLSAKYREGK